LRDDRRAELIQQPVGEHQVREGLAQAPAVDPHLRPLDFGRLVVLPERNRGRARVMADLKSLHGERAAVLGQNEVVVVPAHALHFDELLRSQFPEDRLHTVRRELQGVAEALYTALANRIGPPHHQIHHQAVGKIQVLQSLGDRRAIRGSKCRKGNHRISVPS